MNWSSLLDYEISRLSVTRENTFLKLLMWIRAFFKKRINFLSVFMCYNLLIITCIIKNIDWVKRILQSEFKIIDLREVRNIIDLQVI